MGKAAIILVSAVTMASAVAYMSQDRQAVETMRQEALYEHHVLAREIAQSGFNRIESRVRRDFENHRIGLSDVAHKQGSMDLTASGDVGGAVTISATGRFDDAEYTITGVLSRSGSRILDALTVDAGVDDVDIDGNARISGIDTNPDGSDGPNQDVHAVLTTELDGFTDFTAEMVDGQGVGTNGLKDINLGTPEINLASMGVDIQAYSGAARLDYSGNTDLESVTLGSSSSPVVLVVEDGNLTLSGSFVGYGILYLDGILIMEDQARWEGLVMVENDGGDHILRDDATVYGAVVVRSVAEDGSGDGDDQGLPGGHFDVDVFKTFASGDYRYHEHKYDDDFDVTGIDLLDPTGCEAGGLCWDEILGSEDAVYVQFKNEVFGYGTFNLQAGAGDVTSTCDVAAVDLNIDALMLTPMGFPVAALVEGIGAPAGSAYGVAAGLGFRAPASVLGLFALGGPKFDVCHNGNTLSVGFFGYLSHLFHGDPDGSCSESEDDEAEGGGECVTSTQSVAAVDVQGATHAGLAPTLIDSRELTAFNVNFEYLCALQISSPNGVIYDPTDRNDAFTIQVFDATHDGSSWSQGDLLYETSVYHHTGYGWWDDPGGVICDPLLDGGGDEVVAGDPIGFTMSGDALIQYSSAALLSVADILPQVDPGTGSIRLGNMRENGVRPKDRPRWLGSGLLGN